MKGTSGRRWWKGRVEVVHSSLNAVVVDRHLTLRLLALLFAGIPIANMPIAMPAQEDTAVESTTYTSRSEAFPALSTFQVPNIPPAAY